MANEFYKIYSRAELDLEDKGIDNNLKWHPVRVDWWDVPGRDEKWHQQQLETMGRRHTKVSARIWQQFLRIC